MKAIIMAGGEGRRLKAITGDIPKPMVSFMGRPMMEHIILLLKENGFDDICVTLQYKANIISDYFGSGEKLGVKLQYRIENEPLGTAGSVKNCADFYGDEDFLVISGDVACDFKLKELMLLHKEQCVCASLALHRSSDPLSYGLVLTDNENRIHCFVEKPTWPRVITDLINTGIYALSPKAMEYVPENQAFDFGKNLFPLLLEKSEKLMGYEFDEYWCDVGSPLSYYKCCVDALEGKLKIHVPDAFYAGRQITGTDILAKGISRDCACKNRAELMNALSQITMDLGADYNNGIEISKPLYTLHISPLIHNSAVRLSVQSEDTEFASSLALTTEELIKALNL